jgi:ribose transport system substrate-binding protein
MLTDFGKTIWLLAFCLLGTVPCAAQPAASTSGQNLPLSLAAMQQAVAQASEHGTPWTGPTSGPVAQVGATVAVVCEDLRNGGILGVANGINEASRVIGWKIHIFDARGTPDGRLDALASALALEPDGVIVIGADAKAIHTPLKRFAEHGIPIVGWHVGPFAGPVPDSPVAMNVSTNPLDVARITAMAAVVESGGRAGVVVFTDSNFEIAMAKSNAMADVIRACSGCVLLEIRDIAISRAAESMPAVTKDLLASYGARWTHALAINDIYFDYAAPELTQAGLLRKR